MATTNELSSDYLVDRRRLRRKVTFWRVIALLAVVLVVLVGALRFAGMNGGRLGPQIARVSITGLITGDPASLQLIKDVGNSDAAAVILAINSPGGTTVGSDAIFQEIRKLAAKKPVVAVVGDMAASGAYIAALGADHIVAPGNALVGSIGVLFQYPNFAKLMGTVGVAMEEVKSTPLKAAPNGFEPTSPEARAALASLVSDSYAWFKNLVKTRRNMNDDQLASVDDGRVFTGRQAQPLGLIDQIGDETDAVAWLETNKNITKNLPVRDWKTRTSTSLGLLGFSANIVQMLGFDSLAILLRQGGAAYNAEMLDGLLAVWQAGTVN